MGGAARRVVVEGRLERDRGRVWVGEGRREGSFMSRKSCRSVVGRLGTERWIGFAKVVERVILCLRLSFRNN